MLKQLKPGHYYIVINLDESYAQDVYEVLKYGQQLKEELGEDAWPEGDIDYLQWVRRTWSAASARDYEGALLAAKMGQQTPEREQYSLVATLRARVAELEAERDDARKQNVALQRRLDLVDALSRNTDRIDRLILAAVLRTVGGRVEIPQEHLDAAGHTDFIVSAPTPDKLVVMIEQPEGPEGGDYGHL